MLIANGVNRLVNLRHAVLASVCQSLCLSGLQVFHSRFFRAGASESQYFSVCFCTYSGEPRLSPDVYPFALPPLGGDFQCR